MEQEDDHPHRGKNTCAPCKKTPIPRDWRQFRQAPRGAHETLHPAWSRQLIGSFSETFRYQFSFPICYLEFVFGRKSCCWLNTTPTQLSLPLRDQKGTAGRKHVRTQKKKYGYGDETWMCKVHLTSSYMYEVVVH